MRLSVSELKKASFTTGGSWPTFLTRKPTQIRSSDRSVEIATHLNFKSESFFFFFNSEQQELICGGGEDTALWALTTFKTETFSTSQPSSEAARGQEPMYSYGFLGNGYWTHNPKSNCVRKVTVWSIVIDFIKILLNACFHDLFHMGYVF